MDASLRVPGTNIRFGLDPILGLVPVAGDVVSAAFSLYILREAARLGVPRPVLARMATNIGIDVAVGLVPLLGDAGDVFFKANQRNLGLIDRHLRSQPPRPRADT